MLSAYLLWEASRKPPAARFQWSRSAGAISLAAAAILFFAQLYQAAYGVTTEGTAALGAGAMLFIAGNILYVFGWDGVKRFGFGFAFFLIALPVPDTIHYPLVSTLQTKVASLNVELLNLIGIPAARTGNAIRLPNCVVGIDEACSGIRSLQSAIMATLFIGYLLLRRASLQMVLLLLGVSLAIFGNLLRSFFLSYTANAKGIDAIGKHHDAAGWSILLFTGIGVALFAWLLIKLEKRLARQKKADTVVGEQPA